MTYRRQYDMDLRQLTIPVKEFAQYVKEHVFLGFAAAAVIALAYGKQAFSTDFYVDAEVILNNPHTVYNWDQIGRFGLIALKVWMGNNWYNPYFAAALFLAALWALGMSFGALFSVLCPKMDAGVQFVSISLFLVFPTYAEQFMFRFQSFEIVFSMLLVVFATRYFHLFLAGRNGAAFAAAVVLDVFSFGIYQSMVNLQICFSIAVFLFSVAADEGAHPIRIVKNAVLHFLAGFVVYELIAQVFFSSGDYLGSQVGWLSGDLASTVRNLLAYVKHVLLSSDIFYPVTYPACVCCGILFLIWTVMHDRAKFLPYMTGIGGLLASPFFLALATGTPSPYRAQCMLPFVCAVLWLFFAGRLKEQEGASRGIRQTFCVLCGCVFLLCQASVLMRLFYTQDVVRDADRVTAVQIMSRLQACGGQDKPVVFIGHLDAKTNGSCYTKEEASYLGYSVYEFAYIAGVPVDTPDYFNTGRILGYFETLGFHYAAPSVEMVEGAKAAGADMEAWPAVHSVQETADCIVVKLGE